jgi:hypothetical protein
MMWYIVVCKDHFTGFVAAACIPRKRTSLVAYVLTKIFGFIGFPFILHTYNGMEFTGKPIIDLIKDNAPAQQLLDAPMAALNSKQQKGSGERFALKRIRFCGHDRIEFRKKSLRLQCIGPVAR